MKKIFLYFATWFHTSTTFFFELCRVLMYLHKLEINCKTVGTGKSLGGDRLSYLVKFMFSKKATKIDEIFTINVVSVKSMVKFSSIFVAFLKNTNFKKYKKIFSFQRSWFSDLPTALNWVLHEIKWQITKTYLCVG